MRAVWGRSGPCVGELQEHEFEIEALMVLGRMRSLWIPPEERDASLVNGNGAF
jgi:hypothetical protein